MFCAHCVPKVYKHHIMHTRGWHNNILLFCCLYNSLYLRVCADTHTHSKFISYVLIGVINLTCWQNLMYTSQFMLCCWMYCIHWYTAHFPVVLYFEAIIKAHLSIVTMSSYTREKWRWWKLLYVCVAYKVRYLHNFDESMS